MESCCCSHVWYNKKRKYHLDYHIYFEMIHSYLTSFILKSKHPRRPRNFKRTPFPPEHLPELPRNAADSLTVPRVSEPGAHSFSTPSSDHSGIAFEIQDTSHILQIFESPIIALDQVCDESSHADIPVSVELHAEAHEDYQASINPAPDNTQKDRIRLVQNPGDGGVCLALEEDLAADLHQNGHESRIQALDITIDEEIRRQSDLAVTLMGRPGEGQTHTPSASTIFSRWPVCFRNRSPAFRAEVISFTLMT